MDVSASHPLYNRILQSNCPIIGTTLLCQWGPRNFKLWNWHSKARVFSMCKRQIMGISCATESGGDWGKEMTIFLILSMSRKGEGLTLNDDRKRIVEVGVCLTWLSISRMDWRWREWNRQLNKGGWQGHPYLPGRGQSMSSKVDGLEELVSLHFGMGDFSIFLREVYTS